ncbi:MAG: fumarate hydratase [Lachnospiraceae bacterium]|nr:fumarate hydratase [Lachnospiraceae bacterium]MBR4768406.1 fumarate hydratase [Lachnospiraceae bacterium]
MSTERDIIIQKVADCLVRAGSTFSADKKAAYRKAIACETLERAGWNLETILENAEVAERDRSPLCDDTGIPHIFVEVGPNRALTGDLMDAIEAGIAEGLKELPGRPMAIMGNDAERIDMSGGISPRSEDLLAAPFLVKQVKEDVLRLHVLMLGGGPAIRGMTYRVFHKHDLNVVLNEIVTRSKDMVRLLGCTPCTMAVGVGRSQYEAASMMMEAMVYGDFGVQSDMERFITDELNKTDVGPLGLNGRTTVLATFMRVAPQRASGVRVVAIRPGCCFEPRHASVEL